MTTPFTPPGKNILFVMRHGPYGTVLAREALEAALGTGSFGANPTVLFMDDGVWQLLANQQGAAIQQKNHYAMLSALSLYGVEQLLVEQDSLDVRHLTADDLPTDVLILDNAQTKTLLADCDVVLSF